MDTVLGVSMTPTAVGMVLVEGENADGATVDQDNVDLTSVSAAPAFSPPDRRISAILGTREGAVAGGYRLTSTGVAWVDPMEAAALHQGLAARKIEDVMLVSAFLAAAALAQEIGNTTNYIRTALLYVEPETATLAVVDTADGSVRDVRRRSLPEDDDQAVAELVALLKEADGLETHPDGVVVVGCGVDIPLIKPALEAATSLPVSAPEEPEMALARGAAVAAAHAPLFVSSTTALAYAQDPGTGAVNPSVLAGYSAVRETRGGIDSGKMNLAYSAVPDGQDDTYPAKGRDSYGPVVGERNVSTGGYTDFAAELAERPTRRSFLAVLGVSTIFVVGVVALAVSLAVNIRPHVEQKPSLSHNVVSPNQQLPPPPPKAAVPASAPPVPPAPAASPAPAAAPAPVPAPAAAPVPAPEYAPAPAPVPVAPAPPPALPIPPLIPQLLAPPAPGPPVAPWGGDHGGEGWGHGRGRGDDGFKGPGIGIPGLHLGF
ncbi:MAG: hypothetical protein QJR12_17350 [Mycobacterium sp.]|uniref:DUF7159 family protein n=1 Tax=Mycobacterium sp. TaxID=1785 RepID=UPI00262E000C|nr:hypothetical protein [Mycobacterium sp.]MDI3315963.1 hypothetical protein [Mycobacterium sp.]